jgi:hypothetical protein
MVCCNDLKPIGRSKVWQVPNFHLSTTKMEEVSEILRYSSKILHQITLIVHKGHLRKAYAHFFQNLKAYHNVTYSVSTRA